MGIESTDSFCKVARFLKNGSRPVRGIHGPAHPIDRIDDGDTPDNEKQHHHAFHEIVHGFPRLYGCPLLFWSNPTRASPSFFEPLGSGSAFIVPMHLHERRNHPAAIISDTLCIFWNRICWRYRILLGRAEIGTSGCSSVRCCVGLHISTFLRIAGPGSSWLLQCLSMYCLCPRGPERKH